MSDSCQQYPIEVLADLAAGRLSEAEAAPVRDHVSRCQACRRAMSRVDDLQRAVASLPQMAAQQVVQTDHARIMAGARAMLAADQRRRQSRRSYLRLLVPLSAAVLAVAIGLSAILNMSRESVDGPVVASAIHIEGPVTVGEQTIAVGTHIRTGQQVRTGPGGRLRFGLIGGGTIELNERTVLVLESPQIANATQTDAAAASRVRVERGEVFVDAMALAQYEPVELAASGIVASVDRGAMLNMRVEPVEFARSSGGASIRGLFSRGGGGAGLLHLPLAMTPLPQLAGADTSARVEIAVLAGQVTVKAAGGQTRELQANEHLSYDPTTASWQVSSVRAERFALWRMDGNELLRAAEPLLPRLFAGRSRLLDDGRIEIRYDWSLPSQLRDWQMTGLDDSQLSVYREALRIRGSAGAAGAAGEQRGQLHHVMATGGLVELSYELTTDPRQDWRAGVGIKLHAHDDGRSPEPTGASAAFEQHSDGPSAIAEFSPDGSSVSWSEKTARLAESSVPVQGVIGDGRLQLRVANRTAVDQRLSDELNRGVSPAGDGRGNMVTVYMEVRGQDVFVDDVVIRGRPDARWLRTALGEVLERMEQTGR